MTGPVCTTQHGALLSACTPTEKRLDLDGGAGAAFPLDVCVENPSRLLHARLMSSNGKTYLTRNRCRTRQFGGCAVIGCSPESA